MAVDVTNTQTGGEGTTPQSGADASSVKNQSFDDVSVKNVNADTNDSEQVETPNIPVSEEQNKTPEELPIDLNNQGLMESDESVESEESYIAPLPDKTVSDSDTPAFFEDIDDGFEFNLEDDFESQGGVFEDFDGDFDFNPSINPEKSSSLDLSKNLMKDGYKPLVNGKTLDNVDDETLKSIHIAKGKKGVDFSVQEKGVKPKIEDKPKKEFVKGGIDVDGTRVYEYPKRPGALYTISNGKWYRLDNGKDSWEVVTGDGNIKALNYTHGENVKLDSETKPDKYSKLAYIGKSGEVKDRKPFQGKTLEVATRYSEEKARLERERLESTNLGQAEQAIKGSGLKIGGEESDATLDVGSIANDPNSVVSSLFNYRPDEKTFSGSVEDMAKAQWEFDVKSSANEFTKIMSSEELNQAKSERQNVMSQMEAEYQDMVSRYPDADPEELRRQVEKGWSQSIDEIDDEISELEKEISVADIQMQRRSAVEKIGGAESIIDPYLLRDKIKSKSYGMYSEEGVEEFKDDLDKAFELSLEISKNNLNAFSNRNIDAWAEEAGFSESQVESLKEYQEQVKNSPLIGALSMKMQSDLSEFVEETTVQNMQMREIAASGESIDDFLVSKKRSLMAEIGTSDFVNEETKALFSRTLAIRDYVESYVKSGAITIDPKTGSFSISDSIPKEQRAVIEQGLSPLLEEYNNAKMSMYNQNTEAIRGKMLEVSKMKASLYSIQSKIKNGESSSELIRTAEEYQSRIKDAEKEIESLKLNSNTVLLTDANSIISGASTSATSSARNILKSIDKNLSPKQKFDLFYQRLWDKTKKLQVEYGIADSYAERIGDKLLDMADWEELGISLSAEKEEFYRNQATLRKLAPLYLNNDTGITEESAGFWDSFYNSFIKTFAPTTSDAYGYHNETDALRHQYNTIKQLGMDGEDMSREEAISEIENRVDVPWWGREGLGSMSGTTGAIMFGMIGVGAGTTTVLKGSKSLIKLLDKSGDLYSNVKNINRVETVFDSALQNTRLGRMVMSPVRSGIQFEITGNVIGSMEEEMNFASGFIGAAAGNAMQNIFSKVPVGKLSEHIVRFFGKSAPDAAKIISNFGATIKPMKNLHYRGLGEMFEESAQELTQIYRDELRSRDFWTEVSSIYGEPSNIAQLLISSYVMGAGMGIGSTDYQNNLIEQATSEDIDFANKVMAGLTYDFAEANASAEEAANAIVKNEENLTKDDTKDEQRVSSEEQVGEESIEAEPEQRTGKEEIGDGGMVQEEQAEGEVTEETPKEIESVTAESVEDAQRLWDEGYRAEGVDNKGQLEGMFATGRPGLNMTREAQVEGQVEGKIEEDVKEAKIISLADRIRSGKIDSDIAAAVPVPGFTQAWNTALEGVALTVEGVETAIKKLRAQDWYRNKISDDQRAIIETELEKISVSNNLKGKWNNAISRKANKKGFAEKARDEVKRSSWYKNTLTDEQRAEVDKTLDKKVENINNRISEAESEGLVGKDLSDKIASIKGQNTYRTKRLPSQKKEAIRKATEELKTAKAKFNKAYREGKKAGEEIGEKTQKEREQVKKNLQEALINYVRESLPKGTRSSNTFVTATAKSVTNIDSIEKFNAAKERIDKKIESINDKARVSLADKVFKTLNDTKTYLKGKSGKKKGRISIEAQNKLKTMAAEYSQDKLKSMTADELDILNEEIQEVVDQGRSEVRAGEEQKKQEKQSNKAIIIDALAKMNDTETKNMTDMDEINEYLSSKNDNVVMYDDKIFSSPSALKSYLKTKGLDAVDTDVIAFKQKAVSDKIATERRKAINQARNISTMVKGSFTDVTETIDNRLQKLTKGNKQLREWVDKNVSKAVRDAYIDRDDARMQKLDGFKKKVNEIFGKDGIVGDFVNALSIPFIMQKSSGIEITSKKNPVKLTNDQAIDIYTMSDVDATDIYVVGDRAYSNEEKANARAEATGEEVVKLEKQYNPKLLKQISQDDSLKSGIDKIQEIEKYVESNKKFKDWADYLKNEFYPSMKNDYEQTYKDIYGIEFKQGPYVPMNRVPGKDASSEFSISDVLYGPQFNGASAMSNHLKQKVASGKDYNIVNGAYNKALNYVNTMEHAKHFMPIADNFRTLLNDDTQTFVENKMGINETRELETHMERILSDGKTIKEPETPSAKIMNGILKYKVVSTLMLKLGAVPKQLTSASHFMVMGIEDGVDPWDVMGNASRFLINTSGKVVTGNQYKGAAITEQEQELIQKVLGSAFIRNRVRGGDINLETRKMLEAAQSGPYSAMFSNLSRVLMSPTVLGDIGGVLTGGIPFAMATYNNNVKNKNMSHEEAMDDAFRKFVDAAEKTQQSTNDRILSNAQTSQMVRLLLTFKTSQIAAMSQTINGVRTLGDWANPMTKSEYTPRQVAQAATKAVYFPMSQILFAIAAKGSLMNIYDYLFSDDEEEQEKGKDALYEAAVDTIQSDLQGLGVPGLVGDMGMNILRNREAFNNIPILDMVENIAKGGAESLRVLADGGDITTDMGESRLNNLYRVLGVKNVRDAINSTYQAYNGDLSFYDALMNRWKTEGQIEKGEKAIWEKSPKETKDWIYDWWFRETYDAPDLGPEWVQDGLNITNGMEGVFGNYEDPFESNWDHMENLVDWSNYDGSVSNLEYTEKAEDLQNVYRDYKDIEVKKRAQESNIKQKEKGKSSSDDLTPEQKERWDALLKEVFDEN